ncbi:MAG: biopolymer transporter ExbD [Sphingomonadaceae bacterium]|nr:biopolymer transporter ExbD [Novosphingobium sp.]MCZ8325810.1 biopolymer transporter ExbD [Sphingomonadaceae bacterium]
MGAQLSGGGTRRGRRGRGGRAPIAEINVTPFVDVMLVLLIIFMVTAPLLNAGVPVNLPDSNARALDQEQAQVNLTLDSAGKLYIDDAEVTLAELPRELASVPRGADDKPPLVTLRADKALDYGQVVAVMGELNRAGFNAISLVTNAAAPAAAAPAPAAEPAVTGGSGASPQE